MASYKRGGAASEEAAAGGRQAAERRSDLAEPDEQAIGLLPGIVNDLPEVAPHEWIYLMS